MMRGMFSAISGLKNHQMMLDVTANDIANVNTIGYKSARTTFKDSLTQLQRGASGSSGANGGTNAAQVGLGVGLGSIDNMMTGGALQSTGNPLDVAIQGEGFFAVAQAVVTSPATAIPAGTNAQYTRAGNFTTNTDGYLLTQEGFYVLGRTAASAGAPDTLLRVPPGGTNVAIAQDGSVSYIPAGGGARTTVGYVSLVDVPELGGPRARLGQPLARVGQLRRRPDLDPGQQRHRPDLRGHDRDVQRGPRPVVHADDHRPARLPGQLPRHLDLGRDAAGPGQPQALSNVAVAQPPAAARPGAGPVGGCAEAKGDSEGPRTGGPSAA